MNKLTKLWHDLFHKPQHMLPHTYIPASHTIIYNKYGGYVTGEFITTCPKCSYKSTRKVSFSFYTGGLTELLPTTLTQAIKLCIEYKGDLQEQQSTLPWYSRLNNYLNKDLKESL